VRTELQFEGRLGGIILVALLEVGALIPPWSGDHIIVAVVVEVSVIRAFAPELIAQLDALEGVNDAGSGGKAAGGGQNEERDQRFDRQASTGLGRRWDHLDARSAMNLSRQKAHASPFP